MGSEERLSPPDGLRQAVASLRPEVAAELEDHLHEAVDAARRRGAARAEAEQIALRTLGDPQTVGQACRQAVSSELWLRRGMPLELKAVIVGWMALGILFVSRICVAHEPNHGSIIICILLGLGSMGLGMALLRARKGLWRLSVAASAALTAVTMGLLLQPEFTPRLVAVYGLQPTLITAITIFAAFSVATLNTARPKRWAASNGNPFHPTKR